MSIQTNADAENLQEVSEALDRHQAMFKAMLGIIYDLRSDLNWVAMPGTLGSRLDRVQSAKDRAEAKLDGAMQDAKLLDAVVNSPQLADDLQGGG